jgi:hypothetical protein
MRGKKTRVSDQRARTSERGRKAREARGREAKRGQEATTTWRERDAVHLFSSKSCELACFFVERARNHRPLASSNKWMWSVSGTWPLLPTRHRRHARAPPVLPRLARLVTVRFRRYSPEETVTVAFGVTRVKAHGSQLQGRSSEAVNKGFWIKERREGTEQERRRRKRH